MIDCCATPGGRPASEGGEVTPAECPRGDHRVTPVEWLTVAALARGPVPPRQLFWLCLEPDCRVAYFGSAAAVLTTEDVRPAPGFKTGCPDFVCYCFWHHRDEVVRELEQSGATTILDRIKAEMSGGQCACEIRNPTGKCCLRDVRETIEDLQARVRSEAAATSAND